MSLEKAMDLHGPLARRSAPGWREHFLIVCPQLPHPGGDVWASPAHRDAVFRIVGGMVDSEDGDPKRVFLAGFSYGGNGVLRLAAQEGGIRWKALWAVDPTMAPPATTAQPLVVSAGPYARKFKEAYLRIGLRDGAKETAGSMGAYHDYDAGHGETCAHAFGDPSVFQGFKGLAAADSL